MKTTLTKNKMFTGIICQTIEREVGFSTAKEKKIILASIFWEEYPKHPDFVCANDVNNTKALGNVNCSVVSVCSVKSVSVNKSSSSLKSQVQRTQTSQN